MPFLHWKMPSIKLWLSHGNHCPSLSSFKPLLLTAGPAQILHPNLIIDVPVLCPNRWKCLAISRHNNTGKWTGTIQLSTVFFYWFLVGWWTITLKSLSPTNYYGVGLQIWGTGYSEPEHVIKDTYLTDLKVKKVNSYCKEKCMGTVVLWLFHFATK